MPVADNVEVAQGVAGCTIRLGTKNSWLVVVETGLIGKELTGVVTHRGTGLDHDLTRSHMACWGSKHEP